VPFICNTKIKKEFIRTVDVFPTILTCLNKPLPGNLDGVSLIES